ncbi:5590_t:CDS:2 [Funneliformis geosporum]|uniref:5590_t:CDS:1 n=1 Tax=Funneliformis geosporum TaxID=1117311 RepID=A0A9W4SL89_9GLOM|nr:5590_t:CDS:2 [Funneliformis geosporum]
MDFHSGNIFNSGEIAIIAFESSSSDDEIYGIIPYVAPEIFQGNKYTKASDIYGFGMIMWEFLTGRRPFWDRSHDVDLIIDICDGLRPPLVTNAPEGYIELIQECWHPDPNNRLTADDIKSKIEKIIDSESTANKVLSCSLGYLTKELKWTNLTITINE